MPVFLFSDSLSYFSQLSLFNSIAHRTTTLDLPQHVDTPLAFFSGRFVKANTTIMAYILYVYQALLCFAGMNLI